LKDYLLSELTGKYWVTHQQLTTNYIIDDLNRSNGKAG
jgi:hypothetical protein